MSGVIQHSNVAVIGGAGFLGSHLVSYLIEERFCKVWVFDNLCAGRREFVHPKANFIHCDITKSEAFLRNAFRANAIQHVFNYAAWPYIPDSFTRPLHVFEVNATGAMNVINAAHEAGVQGILQVSSAEIYGGGNEIASEDSRLKAIQIGEDYPVAPHSTYGVAKAAIDYYVQARYREARVPVIALRQFNCIGANETHPYVVPEIISQVAREARMPPARKQLKVKLGNNSYRDFMWAGDAVRMAVELLENGQPGEVYNLGSENGIRIYDLAAKIGEIMGFSDMVQVERDEARVRPWEIWYLLSDNAKIYRTIKARPVLSLEGALTKVINDYSRRKSRWCWETEG